jgi:uncharacterized membrane protein
VLGWENHQIVWRGDPLVGKARELEIRKMYTSQDKFEVRFLLDKYNVTHMIVSAREKAVYGDNVGEMAASLGTKVFMTPKVEIIRF